MKKILVPIDFSDHSEYALKFAANIAKQHNASILAIHMVGLPNTLITKQSEPQGIDAVYFLKLAEKQFNEFLDKEYLKGIDVEPIVKHYSIFQELGEIAESQDANMIVMGSHGSNGLSEVFVGSNTEKVVRTSNVPVFVIKEDNTKELSHTVVACDFRPECRNAFERIIQLLDKLKIQTKLVYINLPGESFRNTNEIEERIDTFLNSLKINHSLSVKDITIFSDYSVESGIFNYAKKSNADSIAIPTHGRKGLAHFFSGSIGEDIANHAKIPVLTVRI